MTAPRLRGILLDNHIGEEFFHLVEREFVNGEWAAWWLDLGINVLDLETLNLPYDTPDDLIWHTCQRESLVLLTGNRNHDGDDSLEETLRRYNQPQSLPVLTISDLRRFGVDSTYDVRLARSILAYLIDIDSFRGTGRLFVPID